MSSAYLVYKRWVYLHIWTTYLLSLRHGGEGLNLGLELAFLSCEQGHHLPSDEALGDQHDLEDKHEGGRVLGKTHQQKTELEHQAAKAVISCAALEGRCCFAGVETRVVFELILDADEGRLWELDSWLGCRWW